MRILPMRYLKQYELPENIEDVFQSVKRLANGTYIVKSRKHEWYDACFIKNIKDKNNLQRVVENFIERQGEALGSKLDTR